MGESFQRRLLLCVRIPSLKVCALASQSSWRGARTCCDYTHLLTVALLVLSYNLKLLLHYSYYLAIEKKAKLMCILREQCNWLRVNEMKSSIHQWRINTYTLTCTHSASPTRPLSYSTCGLILTRWTFHPASHWLTDWLTDWLTHSLTDSQVPPRRSLRCRLSCTLIVGFKPASHSPQRPAGTWWLVFFSFH